MTRKTYYLSVGAAVGYPHPDPERTAWRAGPGAFSDNEYHVWPSREAMVRAVRKSRADHEPNSRWVWHPLRPLVGDPGYVIPPD